jgi:hypothetical protein
MQGRFLRGISSMRFPVFVLGLVVCSLVVGVLLWMLGTSIGKSVGGAFCFFFVAQVVYLLVIAFLANSDRKSLPSGASAPKKVNPVAGVPRRKLSVPRDQ